MDNLKRHAEIVETGAKRCGTCGETKPLSEFYQRKTRKTGWHSDCKSCSKAKGAQWARDNYERAYRLRRDTNLKTKYGITLEEYEDRLAFQGGVCAICGREDPGHNGGKSFAVDHDHASGLVRGLLCLNCNTLLASARDDIHLIERMLEYLEASAALHEQEL